MSFPRCHVWIYQSTKKIVKSRGHIASGTMASLNLDKVRRCSTSLLGNDGGYTWLG